MHRHLAPTLLALAALGLASSAQAAPPPDTLPGTIHFDSGASNVKAPSAKARKKPARRVGNATLNRNAQRDGTGKN